MVPGRSWFMNRNASIAAEAFAAGSFAISMLLTALRTTDRLSALHTEQVLLEPRMAPLSGFSAPVVAVRDNLLSVVSQPTNPVLWALLVGVILAALMHVLTAWRNRDSTPRSWMLPAGLLVAALWPWVLNPAPLAGLALAALSCLLLVRGLSGTLGDTTPDADPVEPILRAGPAPQLIAFIAGWLLVAGAEACCTTVTPLTSTFLTPLMLPATALIRPTTDWRGASPTTLTVPRLSCTFSPRGASTGLAEKASLTRSAVLFPKGHMPR